MSVTDNLGKRMKEFYENVPKTRLVRRTPVAIRIDGKAFHSFTRGFDRPYDQVLRDAMNETMKYLCENIQGCVLGYCQSDEITLILVDYKKLNSDCWFGYEVQKMCSIAASMATMVFNQEFRNQVSNFYIENLSPLSPGMFMACELKSEEISKVYESYQKAKNKGAMFDARCFNIPREEVANLVYWRQLDATRNSIQLAGQSYFSHGQLQHKTCDDIQEMLFSQKGINWNDYPTVFKRGACCVKGPRGWKIDLEIPIFRGEDRAYIENLILPEE